MKRIDFKKKGLDISKLKKELIKENIKLFLKTITMEARNAITNPN